jgi:sporulation protein YlmC with PRC-barrel domain
MEYRGWIRYAAIMAVGLLLFAQPLIAAEEESGGMAADESASTVESAGTAAGRETIDIVGRDVLDLSSERIGQITNVLVGPAGRVEAVVLSTGGILGLGGREYEVPWDRIAMSPDGQDVMVGIAKGDVETEFSAFEVQPEAAPAPDVQITDEPETGSGSSE